ncbi:T9SS type A sorting domain-containing protein [Bizionia myxarmorum]|uniref:T9SS type A sorting domain-containing protein n=1 Tax=Bizionia myxarmorum TaxID=291186 RepID=A0A5D0RHE8_9FLAO|nr:T9SS type A sorting domain-containing protein [Bizionia myxarmorum]
MANAQIVNKGILKISAGTDVYFQNAYTNAVAATHDSDGNLHLNHDFINNGTTVAAAGTTFFKSATNPLIELTGTSKKAIFYNLEINVTGTGKKGVLVADEFNLQVENAMNFQSGDLRLVGRSQLIQMHPGVNGNTVVSGKLLRDQKGTVSPYAYDYWSSPVNNGGTFALLGGKFDGTDSSLKPFNPTQIQFTTAREGLPSTVDVSGNVTTALTISSRWLYKYARGSGDYWEWIRLNSGSTLNPGEGYIMKGANTTLTPKQNYVFYGAPNNGDYSFEIFDGQEILLGNPYPSALNSEQFIGDNIDILQALYFWVDGGSNSHILSDYEGGYAVKNLTGQTLAYVPSEIANAGSADLVISLPFVPIGKGFFVKATSDGTIVFKNSQRVFEMEPARGANDKYVRIGYEGPEGFHRQLLLGFMPDSAADLNYNPGYDALQMMSRADDMFFIIENDAAKRYAIQGVDGFSEAMEFPIGLVMSGNGSHKFMLDAVENFEGIVYLKDNELDVTFNLSDSDYEINLLPGDYLNRFSIVFEPIYTLSNPETQISNVNVFYNGQEEIVVSNLNNLTVNAVTVYNMIGQQILAVTENLNKQNIIRIPFNQSNGVYLVVLKMNTGEKSTKIIKY